MKKGKEEEEEEAEEKDKTLSPIAANCPGGKGRGKEERREKV